MTLKSRGMTALLTAVSPTAVKRINAAVDNELRLMTEEMAVNASDRAPVKTGRLSDSLRKGAYSPEPLRHQLKVDLDNVPYTWRQNFEHQSKRYFITTSFNEIEAQFQKRLQSVVNKS